MRTTRLLAVVSGRGCESARGGGCLGCVCVSRGVHPLDPEAHPQPWIMRQKPPVDRRNDTRLWKHYLPATTVAGGNNP